MKNSYSIDTYAVMGNPVSHSKSPFIHAEFAKQTGQRLQYIKIEVPLDGFKEAVLQFQKQGGKGLNITVPFKQQAYELVDQCSERATIAKALNNIIMRPDGSLYGDNVDGVGLARDFISNHNLSLQNKRILIVGAGGGVQGVLEPLLAEKPQEIFIANRTLEKAVQLARDFAKYGNVQGGGFTDLLDKSFDVIINGTSASLKAELPPLPETLIHPEIFCYDMAYDNKPTVFMEWATQLGAKKVFDGIGMLVEQAAESFLLWRGVRPETKPVIEKLQQERKHSL